MLTTCSSGQTKTREESMCQKYLEKKDFIDNWQVIMLIENCFQTEI